MAELNQGVRTTQIKIWEFVNSSFGLWLLTAIFLTGAGSLWTTFESNLSAEKSKDDRIEQLNIEIPYRFFLLLSTLSEDERALANKSDDAVKAAIKSDLASIRSKPSTNDALYGQFANFSLLALMVELDRLAPDAEVKAHITVLAGMAALDYKSIADAGNQVQEMILPKWRSSGFFFVDCGSKGNPFC